MDIDSSSPQQPAPRQPQPGMPSRPTQPISRRPMVDGFAPRRPMQPASNTPSRPITNQTSRHVGGDAQTASKPIAVAQHTAVPATAALPRTQQPHPFATRPMRASTQTAHRPGVPDMPKMDPTDGMQSASNTQSEHSNTGHVGLVGLATFIVLGILFLLPLVPGKIVQNFPLASSNVTTGNQSLDCIGAQGQLHNSTVYNSKTGVPLTYTYSTSTTQSATCDGQSQSAVVERTSQFSPLALVIDILLAVVIAIVTARIWRMIYTRMHSSPRPKTSSAQR